QEVQSVPDTREIADAVQRVGALPGGLRLRQFRGGALPARARPRRVFLADEAKYIPLKPCPAQLRLQIAHDGGVFRELWGRWCPWGWCRPRGVGAVEMVFQALVGGILVDVGDVVPPLATYQLREEATRIARTSHTGVLCHGQEGESLAVTVANESLRVGLLKEDEEACCILEIVEHNVVEGWGWCGGCPGSSFLLAPITSRCPAGGDWDWIGWSKSCRGCRWSGFVVLEFLQGFLVYTREW